MWWYYKRATFNWTSHCQYKGTSMKEYDIQNKISGYNKKNVHLCVFCRLHSNNAFTNWKGTKDNSRPNLARLA
jgi:hypothetical protein